MGREIDLYNIGLTPEELRKAILDLRADYDTHNHDGGSSLTFQTVRGETFSGRAVSIKKVSFTDDNAGFWLGLVQNTLKMYVGSASSYFKWDGTMVTMNGSITIGTGSSTAGIDATVTAGDDVRFYAGSATPSLAPFQVTESGQVTAIGLSSLNKKAYTNFESSGRFISSTGGTGSNTFGNQGVTIAPGATGTSFSKLLWDVGNVMTNNPTFTCTINVLGLVAASGSSRCFVGLGSPTVTGAGITYTSINHIGFTINKDSGVVNVGGQNGDGSGSVGANFTTIVDNDILELFIKVTATAVKYYYRKNGGTITLGNTTTTNIPTATGESSICFATSNAATAFNCQLILQCAAYEH